MQVIKRNLKDFYPTMVSWATGNNFILPTEDMLPETVFICLSELGEPSHSVTVYNTDSKLAWLAWELKNPEVSNKGGLEYLIKRVTEYLELSGYRYIFTTSDTPPVIKALLNNGYSEGDTKVNHYLKVN